MTIDVYNILRRGKFGVVKVLIFLFLGFQVKALFKIYINTTSYHFAMSYRVAWHC